MAFNVSQIVLQAAAAVLAGSSVLPDGRPLAMAEELIISREDFYHRQDCGTTATKLTYFNQSESEYVTNWPAANGLPDDEVFILNGLRAHVGWGYDTAGNAESAAGANQADQDPMTILSDIKTVLESGLVTLKVGNQTVCQFFGIYKAPAGGGVEADFSTANTTASTILAMLASVRNGTPHDTNGYAIPPYLVTPGRPVRLTVAWNQTHDILANSDLVLKWELFGTRIRPANS